MAFLFLPAMCVGYFVFSSGCVMTINILMANRVLLFTLILSWMDVHIALRLLGSLSLLLAQYPWRNLLFELE